ncbi:MAG: Abi family protein [Desulfobacterales bacterium]|nr:Abi family protein [Desulfobacterales bacterium]
MVKNTLSPPKPHQNYSQLVALLESRGMIIPDSERAKRKLSQIGYYRLSGFWFPCREVKKNLLGTGILHPGTKQPIRENTFQAGVDFNEIVELYLFDKKLRLLMLDAIERIEIHIRSVVAHEMGYHDPLAYQNDKFINPKKKNTWKDRKTNKIRNLWVEWSKKQQELIRRSKEDCIKWHKAERKAIPFWVAVESWDLGNLSKYYSMLRAKYQRKICLRLGISNEKTLENWLHEINILRNRCAHHTRIWNQSSNNSLPVLPIPYFAKLSLDARALKRMYGMICIMWFLVKRIGPSSHWLETVSLLINSKPSIDCCPLTAMGFSDNTGFPDINNF